MRWFFLAVLGCALPSCMAQTNAAGESGASPATGDMTFLWSFDGQTCAQAAQVRLLRISIVGPYGSEPLDDLEDGYPCRGEGVDGIALRAFRAGSYTFTLDALDASGQALYTATGSAFVQSGVNVRVPVTLHSVSQRGLVKISWTFGPDQRPCARAGIVSKAGIVGPEGVSEVIVRVDGEVAQSFPCADASSSEGGDLWLDEGTHQLQLDGAIARGGEKQTWYSVSRSLTLGAEAIASRQPTPLSVTLDVVAAQAIFVPVADAQGAAFSCATAGVSVLLAQVVDQSVPPNCFPKDARTGGCGKYVDCDTIANEGFAVDYLPVAGTFDSSSRLWQAVWKADFQAFSQLGSNPLYKGSLSQLIEAGTVSAYSVPMVRQP
jgi:hypothetical protein